MKICIYGAGATGCTVAARLSKTDAEISLIARGEHLKKIQENGLKYINYKGEEIINFQATDNPAELGPQDYIIISTKAYSLPEVARDISPLIGEETSIIPACNGIPWWFFYNFGGEMNNYQIKCLDPDGIIADAIDPDKIIGGLYYMAASIKEPGVVTNFFPARFVVGCLEKEPSDKFITFRDLMREAGFKNSTAEDIRREIWNKICWNAAFNTMSVIYNKTSGQLAEDPETRKLAANIMLEIEKITNKLGIDLNLDIEDHMKIAEKVYDFKPSMFQDFENGKPMEIDAIIGSIVEIAGQLNLDIPNIKDVYFRLKAIAEG